MKDFSVGRSGGVRVPVAIAVDLGGTRVRAAMVGADGRPGPRVEAATDRRSADRLIAGTASLVSVAAAGLAPGVPVVVGATGPIDADGRLLDPPNLEPGFHGLPLRAALEAALGRPVLVGLDTHLALLGEAAWGALRDVDDGLYLTVSTGVGGAILAGGRLLAGARGLAGELGHLPVMAGGPRCGCGARGHLEAVAAGPAIAAAAVRRALRHPGTPLAGRVAEVDGPVTGADVWRWARDGDRDAAAVLRRARGALAVGVAALVALLDPQRVVIGGGVVLADPEPWLGACRDRLARLGSTGQRGDVAIVPAALGDDAGLHGAIAYARLVRPGLLPAPDEGPPSPD